MRTAHISTAARVPRSASSLSLLTCLMTGVVYTPPVLRRISIRNITNMETGGHLRNLRCLLIDLIVKALVGIVEFAKSH